MLREDILLLPGAEMSHLVRPDKGHEIFVKTSEALMDRAAEYPPCDPLQWGKINLHMFSPVLLPCLHQSLPYYTPGILVKQKILC